jgi:hypothetical protein
MSASVWRKYVNGVSNYQSVMPNVAESQQKTTYRLCNNVSGFWRRRLAKLAQKARGVASISWP